MSAPPTPASHTTRSLKTLRTDRQGPVLSIELNAPDQGNTVTEPLLDELLTVLDQQGPDVRAIVLSGAGTNFCLGGDRGDSAEQLAQDPTGDGIRTVGAKARRVCEALSTNPAVTIARVQGKAIGADLALALACDLWVGAETATFRLPELALGIPTTWGPPPSPLQRSRGSTCPRTHPHLPGFQRPGSRNALNPSEGRPGTGSRRGGQSLDRSHPPPLPRCPARN